MNTRISLMQIWWTRLFLLSLVLLPAAFFLAPVLLPVPQPAPYDYNPAELDRCEPAALVPLRPVSRIESPAGDIELRLPANYDPTRQHALLMVFAPAGFTPKQSERFYAITAEATRRGVAIAFLGALPLQKGSFERAILARTVLEELLCIALGRVSYLGHSDGGSLIYGMLFAAPARPVHVAIISAAGIAGADLKAYPCPSPERVHVFHSAQDELFSGFGEQAHDWWQRCGTAGSVTFSPGKAAHAVMPQLPMRLLDELNSAIPTL